MVSAVARVSSDEPKSGSAPHLHIVTFSLTQKDAKDLGWYLRHVGFERDDWCQGLPASGVESSTFGVQLEALARRSGGSKDCDSCKGHGWVGSKRHRARLAGKTKDPHGELLHLFTLWEQRVQVPKFDRMCDRCNGKGSVPRETKHRARGPITARPTGSSVSQSTSGGAFENDDLIRMASVHRKLKALYLENPKAARVLSLYYETDPQALVSLWHLTPSGITMLHENGQNLRYVEFFSNLRDEQQQHHDETRALQFEAANTQAQELLDAAAEAWVRVNG